MKPGRRRVPVAVAIGPLVALGLAVGCASTPKPPPARAAAPAPPDAETVRPEEPKLPPTLVVIDPGGSDAQPRSLAEASRDERARRRREQPRTPVAVITDKNLAEYAAKGKVTVAEPGAREGEPAEGGATAGAEEANAGGEPGTGTQGGGGPRDETYWRGKALEIRQRWAQADEEVAALEKESAALRWKFYAEDDAYYRDQQIKPEWDRVLDDLRRARQDVRSYRRELAELMEEGRRSGALPGWLREGIELEPPAPDAKQSRPAIEEHQSVEPTVVEEPPQ